MLPELRVLYFEDLTIGLAEELRRVIAASDVVGFAEVTGGPQSHSPVRAFRGEDALRPSHRPRSLHPPA